MLKHRLPAVLLAAVVVFVPAACRKNETPAAAEAAAASLLQGPMPVTVETVPRHRISEQMTFTGVFQAAR